ncbi:14681_t:CDS:2 [Funneliformis mosseae]|uniref:14681_t:CDS:1 n=1 Tax=Funneliformis mosseae TaxID=27381 RepID=A0A9N9DJF6_FUNMO|nr:14681_t:CDS:2 [Funneliformis mosseae]
MTNVRLYRSIIDMSITKKLAKAKISIAYGQTWTYWPFHSGTLHDNQPHRLWADKFAHKEKIAFEKSKNHFYNEPIILRTNYPAGKHASSHSTRPYLGWKTIKIPHARFAFMRRKY